MDGLSIINNATRHLKEGRKDLMCIEVPEWGDDSGPAKIYYYPVISCADKARVLQAHESDPVDALIMTLIVRGLDENGERLFRPPQRQQLRRVLDAKVVARIVTEMEGETDDPSLEDALGN